MIKLPPRRRSLPHIHTGQGGGSESASEGTQALNSWGTQWWHLPRSLGRLTRFGSRLRVMRDD